MHSLLSLPGGFIKIGWTVKNFGILSSWLLLIKKFLISGFFIKPWAEEEEEEEQ